MKLSAEGRTVLITGGSQGLGLATARAFAQAGADVAIVARRAEPLEAARADLASVASGKILTVVCDVAIASDVERAFTEVTTAFGRVDVLVNNAGKSQASQFEGISDEIWQADLDLKLFAAIRMTRLAWPGMKARRWGRVINVLNTYAKAPSAGTAPTSVTRAAGLALTKVLSAEGAPHNILVNALLVGLIESEQTHRRHQSSDPRSDFESFKSQMGQRVPMGRIGRAEEFGNTALFLGSEASSYVTGTAINIDGGSCPVV
jgi:NAD(P)-dependent dehydrogenase (short-subunit alcohol dehydrogenase family)